MTDFSSQYKIEDELERVKLSRFEILSCLVDVVNQSCQVKVEGQKCFVDHMCISAYEDAFDMLERFGILKTSIGRQCWIDWEELEKKKP